MNKLDFLAQETRSYNYIAASDKNGAYAEAIIIYSKPLGKYYVGTFQRDFNFSEDYGIVDSLPEAIKLLKEAVMNLIDTYKQLAESNGDDVNPEDYNDWWDGDSVDSDDYRITKHFER